MDAAQCAAARAFAEVCDGGAAPPSLRSPPQPRLHDGLGSSFAVGHRSGFAFAHTTDQREDMLLRHRNQLSEAWRQAPRAARVDDESADDASRKQRKSYTVRGGMSFQQLSGDALFEQRKAQLSNAWRNPPGSQALHERRRLSEAWKRP